jgi:hypothetical protein
MASLVRRATRRGLTLVEPYLWPLKWRFQQMVTASTLAALDEANKMMRIQGDADDELAETLGRTLARLSAEVEALADAVARLEAANGLRASERVDAP